MSDLSPHSPGRDTGSAAPVPGIGEDSSVLAPLRGQDAFRDEEPVQLGYDDAGQRQPRQPVPPFWQRILSPGECVLWTGAPDPALARPKGPHRRGPARIALGLGSIAGLALVWQSGEGIGSLFGIGFALLCAVALVRLRPAAGTPEGLRYLLSDRAIYTARLHPGEEPEWHRTPLTRDMPVSGTDSSVVFTIGTRAKPGGNSQIRPVTVSFHDIRDAAELLSRVRSIQKGMK